VENDLELGEKASPVLRRVLTAHLTRLLSRGGGPLNATAAKSADDDDDLNTTLDDTIDDSIQSPGSNRENSGDFIEDGHSTTSSGDDDGDESSPTNNNGATNQQVIHLDQFMSAVQAMMQQQQNQGEEGVYGGQGVETFSSKRSSESYARAAARQMAEAEAEERAWRQKQRGPVPVVKRVGGGYFVGYGKPGGPTTPGGRPQLSQGGTIGRAVGYGPTGWGRLPLALKADPAARPGTQERLAAVSQRREAWLAQKQLRQEWQAAGGQGPVPRAFALCPEGARARSYTGFGFGGGGGGGSADSHRYSGSGVGKRPRSDFNSGPPVPAISHHEPVLALPPSPVPAASSSSSSPTRYQGGVDNVSPGNEALPQDFQSNVNQHHYQRQHSNHSNAGVTTASAVSFMHRGTLTGPSLTNFAPDGSMGSIQEASSDESDSSEDGDQEADKKVNTRGDDDADDDDSNDGDGAAMNQDASASSDLDARIEAAIAQSMASLGQPRASSSSVSDALPNDEPQTTAAAAPEDNSNNSSSNDASSSSDSAYQYGRSKHSPPTPGHALAPPPVWPEGGKGDDEDDQFQDARSEQVATPKVTFKTKAHAAVRFADSSPSSEHDQGDEDKDGEGDEAAPTGTKPVNSQSSGGAVGLSPTMQLFGRNKQSPATPGHALAPALPEDAGEEDDIDEEGSGAVVPGAGGGGVGETRGPVTAAPSAIGGKKKKNKKKNKKAGVDGPKVGFVRGGYFIRCSHEYTHTLPGAACTVSDPYYTSSHFPFPLNLCEGAFRRH